MCEAAEEKELERAKLHGPDTRTIDALQVATLHARQAEADFMQVHKNCIEARERCARAEAALDDAATRMERARGILSPDRSEWAMLDTTEIRAFAHTEQNAVAAQEPFSIGSNGKISSPTMAAEVHAVKISRKGPDVPG